MSTRRPDEPFLSKKIPSSTEEVAIFTETYGLLLKQIETLGQKSVDNATVREGRAILDRYKTSVNAVRDGRGRTLLAQATAQGQTKLMLLLLELGADLNLRDKSGKYALRLARDEEARSILRANMKGDMRARVFSKNLDEATAMLSADLGTWLSKNDWSRGQPFLHVFLLEMICLHPPSVIFSQITRPEFFGQIKLERQPLAAILLFDACKRSAGSAEGKADEMLELGKMFETMCTSYLSTADLDVTNNMLTEKVKGTTGREMIDVAIKSESLSVIIHSRSERYLTFQWVGLFFRMSRLMTFSSTMMAGLVLQIFAPFMAERHAKFSAYRAVRAHWCLDFLCRSVFLLLLTFFVLSHPKEDKKMFPVELAFWSLLFACAISELEQFIHLRGKHYVSSVWNVVDLLIYSVSIASFLIRFGTLRQHSYIDIFDLHLGDYWVNMLGFAALLLWVRHLEYLSIFSTFGPLISTLSGMVTDALVFTLIFATILTGFSVVTSTLLPPSISFFQINYGLVLSIFGQESETVSLAVLTDHAPFFGPVIFLCFLAATVYLLLNLLIAQFSYTFSIRAGDTSIKEYKIGRAKQIRTLALLPILPPPLNILELPFLCIADYKRRHAFILLPLVLAQLAVFSPLWLVVLVLAEIQMCRDRREDPDSYQEREKASVVRFPPFNWILTHYAGYFVSGGAGGGGGGAPAGGAGGPKLVGKSTGPAAQSSVGPAQSRALAEAVETVHQAFREEFPMSSGKGGKGDEGLKQSK